jgi:hypothetical protein
MMISQYYLLTVENPSIIYWENRNTCTNYYVVPCQQSRSATFISKTALPMTNEDEIIPAPTRIPTIERGVSMDQDGKSNVWAIEPKVEIESKSAEEKGAQALVAGGGLAVFAVLAGVILTNLPDPNQF